MKSRKILYVVAGGIISSLTIVLIATVCLLSLSVKDDSTVTNSTEIEPNEIQIHFSNALIVHINYSALWAFDVISGNSVFVTQNWNDSFTSFDFYKKKNVYFGSSMLGKPISSLSKTYPVLKQPGKWNSEKIAVDNLNGKIYVIDGWASKINIFDILGEHYSIVESDFGELKDIALDPTQGFMFILQSSSILKSNMDGTSTETLIKRIGISAFAIEREEKKMYWTGVASIESADHEGSNNKIVTKISNIVSSVAALKNRLFWLYPPYGFEDSILWTCTVVNDVCTDISSKIFIDNAVEIKAYNFNPLEIPNPCKQETDGCQHMCILTSKSGRSCACTIGWQLKSDCKNCKPINDFLLFVQGNFIKGRILDFTQNIFIEAMLPIRLNTASLVQKRVIDFDYDARQHIIVFSDDWTLYELDLKPGSEQITIGGEVGYDIIPAIDWVSKNLYYIRATRWEGTSHISVRNMKPYNLFGDEKIIYESTEYQYPTSLVIYPNQGLIFFTLFDSRSNKVKILKMNSNGSRITSFGKNLTFSVNETELGIDYVDERLYWFSQDTNKVYHATLDGFDLNYLDVSIVKHPRTMSVYDKWIYISNLTTVWRLHKKTGMNAVKIVPEYGDNSKTIYGAKVFSQNLQFVNENHPCAINNGGCERYCFAIPLNNKSTIKQKLQKVCDCNDSEILQIDGKSCISNHE